MVVGLFRNRLFHQVKRTLSGKMLTDFSKEVFENLGKEAINSIVISGVIDGLYSRFIADGLNPKW